MCCCCTRANSNRIITTGLCRLCSTATAANSNRIRTRSLSESTHRYGTLGNSIAAVAQSQSTNAFSGRRCADGNRLRCYSGAFIADGHHLVHTGHTLIGLCADGNNVLAINILCCARTDTDHIIGRNRIFYRTLAHGNITPCAVGAFARRFADGDIRLAQCIGTLTNGNRLVMMCFAFCTNRQAGRAGSGRICTQSHIALARCFGR